MSAFTRHKHGAWCHPSADGCPETMPAPDLSPVERAVVERFEDAAPAPESAVWTCRWARCPDGPDCMWAGWQIGQVER